MEKRIRLNKYLADHGVCSRRKADECILNKDVMVNGEIGKIGQTVDPEKDIILYKNKPVEKKIELKYYALNKPKGYVTTAQDEMDRPNVVDLVKSPIRVYPVGRLDMNSEGLVILTNDGALANILTHPRNEHEKAYDVIVKSKKEINIDTFKEKFLNGFRIDGKRMKADKIQVSKLHDSGEFISNTIKNKPFLIQISLHTGYNRQIRKMCAKIGLEVLKLTRTKIAKLKLADLELDSGEFKEVSKDQIL